MKLCVFTPELKDVTLWRSGTCRSLHIRIHPGGCLAVQTCQREAGAEHPALGSLGENSSHWAEAGEMAQFQLLT